MKKSNRKLDSVIPPIIIFLHFLIFSITFSCSDYLSYLSVSSILYHTNFAIALIFYLITSLKDPGVIQSLKLIRPGPVHSTEPQSIDFSHNLPLTEAAHKKNPEKPPEPKEIEDENSGPISISVLGKNPIHDSDEEPEPDQISVEIQQAAEESSIHIETRFCTKCSIEQPLRAKHCKYCDVCIALYDHHCPWMGNCIGERNKFFFWWYLMFELITISWTIRILVSGIEASGGLDVLQKNWKVILGLTVSGFFEIFVGFLFVFHCFLIAKNKTTWEQLSWNNISYLNKWPKNLGSPFSQGAIKNIQYFCCKSLPKGYTLWIFPTKIPG